ncbi:hypothetical protein FBR02_18415 [Anaerolineae bacterium CFX9]|nr:hypothetical protein [Anaerolineae bacterium CFX9]
MYADNELLFPHHVIPHLRDLGGARWKALVERVMSLSQSHDETLAFMLMMVRLNGCLPCETDSFRAMRGCAPCAIQTLRRFKGTEDDLLRLYQQALGDVRTFAQQAPHYGIVSAPDASLT